MDGVTITHWARTLKGCGINSTVDVALNLEMEWIAALPQRCTHFWWIAGCVIHSLQTKL